jgi:hypothetical protein
MADSTQAKAIAKEVVAELKSDPEFQTVLKNLIAEAVESKLKEVRTRLDKLELTTEVTDGKVFDLQNKCDQLSVRCNNLEQQYGDLANHMNHQRIAVQETQQYTRRNCLLITGVPEKPDERDGEGKIIPEDTDSVVKEFVKEKLGFEIDSKDIDRTHRSTRSKRSDGKARGIIAKFTTYNTRSQIIKARKKLKGTGMGIQELLTKAKQELLTRTKMAVKNFPRFQSAWSWDGTITLLVADGKGKNFYCTINSAWELTDIAKSHGQ